MCMCVYVCSIFVFPTERVSAAAYWTNERMSNELAAQTRYANGSYFTFAMFRHAKPSILMIYGVLLIVK